MASNRPRAAVSYTAEQALREFSSAFDRVYTVGEGIIPWASVLGHEHVSDALVTVFPMPISAAGYHKFLGERQLRRLSEREIRIEVETYEDGVREQLRKIERGPWSGWGNQPAAMALEAVRFPNVLTAAMLHANPRLDLYVEKHPGGNTASAIRLFADAHPVNIFDTAYGTFDNDHTCASAAEDLFTEGWARSVAEMYATRKAPNGQPAGLSWTDVLVPSGYEYTAHKFFESSMIIELVRNAASTIVGGVPMDNRFKGKVTVHTGAELLDSDLVYTFARNKGEASPPAWVLQRNSAPRQIVFDAGSEECRKTGDVSISYELDAAATAAVPLGIDRHAAFSG